MIVSREWRKNYGRDYYRGWFLFGIIPLYIYHKEI